MVAQQIISMGRGNVISKETIESNPGCYPVFSSSATGDGIIGHYAEYMFDDERISWSIDGGGKFFYHPISRYSVTNVSGWIKVHKQDEISTRFLYLALDAEWQTKHFDYQTKAHPSVIKNEYTVIYPAIDKQHEITTTIASCENHIAALQALITKYEAIKKATVNLLLKQNQGWRNVKLGDVLKVCHGKCQHLIESEAGLFPILATSGVIGRANQFLYDKPSVLIGRKGTIDKPQYIETPFWTIDTLFYTKVADGYIPKFVFYLCQTIDWASLNEASGVPSLSANRIESIEVCVPQNMHEQKRIVAALDSIDNTIKGLKTQLEKSQAIKHGMMSYFFG